MLHYIRKIFFLTVLCTFQTGCWLVYKENLQQGNIITRNKLAQLNLGMNQDQVLRLMGSPMLESYAQGDHWEYVYACRLGQGKWLHKRVSLYFSSGILRAIRSSKTE